MEIFVKKLRRGVKPSDIETLCKEFYYPKYEMWKFQKVWETKGEKLKKILTEDFDFIQVWLIGQWMYSI